MICTTHPPKKLKVLIQEFQKLDSVIRTRFWTDQNTKCFWHVIMMSYYVLGPALGASFLNITMDMYW